MTFTQTVDVPDTRWLKIKVPQEVPTGKMQVIIQFPTAQKSADEDSAPAFEPHPCPICREKFQDPVTGEMRYGPKTMAALEEGRAILRGEIPAKWYDNFDDFLADLNSDDDDEDEDNE